MNVRDESAIIVSGVYKSFRLPHEQTSGLKQTILNIFRKSKDRVRGYETQHVLDDISFEIKKGEFFGIVGRNGSGKSTLLKLLAEIYTPDRGDVHVSGTLTPFIELGVGFNPELTGRENVFLNGALLGFSRADMDAMYDDIVEFAELERFMDQKLKNYSSGMQVRLAFSIAIRADGDILLLDEVLAVGDEAFQQKCFKYFNELKSKKKTVIIVTHDMGAVERFCTRAMVIEKGKIKLIGKPSEVADEYRQENIPNTQSNERHLKKDEKNSLNLIIKDEKEYAELIFQAKTETKSSDYYVGITLFKNDSNIGEINSRDIEMSNHFKYRIQKAQLNPGRYEVSAALFKRDTRTLVAIYPGRRTFLIKGHDENRGSGMKLASTWANNE